MAELVLAVFDAASAAGAAAQDLEVAGVDHRRLSGGDPAILILIIWRIGCHSMPDMTAWIWIAPRGCSSGSS
jgi:hypothetical protein